jgi:hypothetical protein
MALREQRRLRDDTPVPNVGDQIVLADHAFAVTHKIDQEIEHLRFDGHQGAGPAQLPTVRVQFILVKQIPQETAHLPVAPAVDAITVRPEEKSRKP